MMNDKMIELFYTESVNVFSFLENQYNFVGHKPTESKKGNHAGISIQYILSNILVQPFLILDSYRGPLIDTVIGHVDLPSDDVQSKNRGKDFWLSDLVHYLSQGIEESTHTTTSLSTLSHDLSVQAESLKANAIDILQGDSSIFVDVLEVNRKRDLRLNFK